MPRKPKEEVSPERQAAIDFAQLGEAKKSQPVSEQLPTAQEQLEAVAEPDFHIITLLDDTEVLLSKALTVKDILKKRIDGKIRALVLTIQAEAQAKFKSLKGEAQFDAVLSSCDDVFNILLELLATLTGEPLQRFQDNLSLEQAANAFVVLIKMLQNASPIKKA